VPRSLKTGMTTEIFIDVAQSELSISGAASENASPARTHTDPRLQRTEEFRARRGSKFKPAPS
jgi:hypothetical protein